MSNKDSMFAGFGPKDWIAIVAMLFIVTVNAASIALLNLVLPSVVEVLGVTKVEISYVLVTASACGFILGTFVGPRVMRKVSAKYFQTIGCVATVIWMIGLATITDYAVLVPFAFFSGAVQCFATFTPITALCGQYWGKNGAKFYGIIAGVELFLVAGYSTLMTMLFQATGSYQSIFLCTAVVAAVGLLLNLTCIKKPDAEAAARAAEADAAKKAANAEKMAGADGMMVKEGIKSPAFWLFVIGLMAGAIITAGVSSYGTTLFTSVGAMDKADAAFLMSTGYMTFGAIHFLYCGFFARKFSSRNFAIFMYGGIIIGLAILIWWTGHQIFAIAAVGLFFVALIKPVNSLPALFLPDLFGWKDYAAFSTIVMGFYYLGVCISQLTTARIMQSLGGASALYYLIIMAFVSLVALFLAYQLSPYKKAKRAEAAAGEAV